MGTLEQYWRKAAASLNKVTDQHTVTQPRLEELEREILTLTSENLTLTGKLERIRADFERCRIEDLCKIETLEQIHAPVETGLRPV